MATLRQNSDLVAFDEIGEADCALRRRHPLFLRISVNVSEFRYGLEHLLLEAFVRQRLSRRRSGAGAAAPEKGAASDGDEADDADESAEQGGEDDHEV